MLVWPKRLLVWSADTGPTFWIPHWMRTQRFRFCPHLLPYHQTVFACFAKVETAFGTIGFSSQKCLDSLSIATSCFKWGAISPAQFKEKLENRFESSGDDCFQCLLSAHLRSNITKTRQEYIDLHFHFQFTLLRIRVTRFSFLMSCTWEDTVVVIRLWFWVGLSLWRAPRVSQNVNCLPLLSGTMPPPSIYSSLSLWKLFFFKGLHYLMESYYTCGFLSRFHTTKRQSPTRNTCSQMVRIPTVQQKKNLVQFPQTRSKKQTHLWCVPLQLIVKFWSQRHLGITLYGSQNVGHFFRRFTTLCKLPIGIMQAKVSEFCVALLWGMGWVLYHLWGPRVII